MIGLAISAQLTHVHKDPIHSSYNKWRSQSSVRVFPTFQHGNGMTRSETAEHLSFLHMEEGSLSRILAFDCGHNGHGYAQ